MAAQSSEKEDDAPIAQNDGAKEADLSRLSDDQVAALVASNLHYFGETKLSRLDSESVSAIFRAMREEVGLPGNDAPEKREDAVKEILQMKKMRKTKAETKSAKKKGQKAASGGSQDAAEDLENATERPTDDALAHSGEPAESRSEALPIEFSAPLVEAPAGPAAADDPLSPPPTPSTPTFVKRNSTRICFFNSHKLRTSASYSFFDQWNDLYDAMRRVDVVMLSEVPARNETVTHLEVMKALLEKSNGPACARQPNEQLSEKDAEEKRDSSKWNYVSSTVSGGEVHVAFVKEPCRIVNHASIAAIGTSAMHHAPLEVQIHNPSMQAGFSDFVVTSVHLPTAKDSKRRDAQLCLLTSDYALRSEMRFHTPFTRKGASDARKSPVAHVLGGDFNVYPGLAQYDLEKNGWAQPLIGSKVATSAGRKSYDNVLVDQYTASRFTISTDVLELSVPQNDSTSQEGVSDHYPVVVSLREAQSVA